MTGCWSVSPRRILSRAHTPDFKSSVCTIDNTYVAEEHLTEKGKVDYETLKPVLFEFPTYQYMRTGDVIGNACPSKRRRKNEEDAICQRDRRS